VTGLQEATSRLICAAEARDLDRIEQALGDRAGAIADGDIPTAELIAEGDRALLKIREILRETSIAVARLNQIREAVIPQGTIPKIDYHG
jgi:hypothetical protein